MGRWMIAVDDEAYFIRPKGDKIEAWDSRLTPEQRKEALRFLAALQYTQRRGIQINVEDFIEAWRDYMLERRLGMVQYAGA